MIIEYNIKNNLKNIYNEVFEIILKKKKILSTKTKKVNNFTKSNITRIIIYMIIGGTVSGILKTYEVSNKIIIYIDWFLLALCSIKIYNQLIFNKSLKQLEKNTTPNKVVINNNELIDISNDIEIKTNIKKITYIIVGSFSINIMGEDNFHLYFPIEIKNEIIKAIKKYNKNIKIIELNKKVENKTKV